jgi:hypothetical protein
MIDGVPAVQLHPTKPPAKVQQMRNTADTKVGGARFRD